MLKLHKVKRAKRGNRFCGPAVISALTGMTTDEASRLIRHVSPHRTMVAGTHTSEVLEALRLCGIHVKLGRMSRYYRDNRPTLAKWLSDTVSERSAGRVFLLIAGNHWQLVSGRRFVCGQTVEIVGFTHEKVKRRRRVEECYELIADTVSIPKAIVAKPAARVKEPAEAEARRLAGAYGVDLEKERDSDCITVYPPDRLFEDEGDDPYDGNHIHYEWSAALEAVRAYVALCRRANLRIA